MLESLTLQAFVMVPCCAWLAWCARSIAGRLVYSAAAAYATWFAWALLHGGAR